MWRYQVKLANIFVITFSISNTCIIACNNSYNIVKILLSPIYNLESFKLLFNVFSFLNFRGGSITEFSIFSTNLSAPLQFTKFWKFSSPPNYWLSPKDFSYLLTFPQKLTQSRKIGKSSVVSLIFTVQFPLWYLSILSEFQPDNI